jgi:NAD(P)-dependent dehydrogenase (short-subunit alcohol dehydrogenase family)
VDRRERRAGDRVGQGAEPAGWWLPGQAGCQPPAQEAVTDIRAEGGTADFAAADLSGQASARQLARRAAELGGGHVDILVNNAGIYPFGSTHETAEADFDRVFDLNVKAPFFLVAELAPKTAARGHGVIVNVTTMAAEYRPAGVRVNAVSPGPTRTEGTADLAGLLDQLAAAAPSGRPGLPEEIASAIAYLASGEASFVQGALLPVDGGRIAV